jgi:hypothetical protein
LLTVSKKPIPKNKKIIVHSSFVKPKQIKQKKLAKPFQKSLSKVISEPLVKANNSLKKKKDLKITNIFSKDLENCFKTLKQNNSQTHKKSNDLTIPQKIEKLHISNIFLETPTIDSYEEKLINHLQDNLRLPHIGKVKLEITISNNGKLKELTILQSENSENARYLKNQLHTLIYPCFNCNKLNQSYIINFNSLK